MSGLARTITTVAVAASLAIVPTGALASTPAPAAANSASTASAAEPWLTLSAMTSTSSSTAANAAALRHEAGHPGLPPLPALLIIASTVAVAIWIALNNDDGGNPFDDLSPD